MEGFLGTLTRVSSSFRSSNKTLTLIFEVVDQRRALTSASTYNCEDLRVTLKIVPKRKRNGKFYFDSR